jgi:hypothetical protein
MPRSRLCLHTAVVTEILGHSQISITMDTYSHVGPALGVDAAEKMNDVVTSTPVGAKKWGQNRLVIPPEFECSRIS